LIGPRKFVDRRQNSVVPLSNEFLLQVIENKIAYMLPSRRFHAKKYDFRCFRLARAVRDGVARDGAMGFYALH
jgi:hypothetical protein